MSCPQCTMSEKLGRNWYMGGELHGDSSLDTAYIDYDDGEWNVNIESRCFFEDMPETHWWRISHCPWCGQDLGEMVPDGR